MESKIFNGIEIFEMTMSEVYDAHILVTSGISEFKALYQVLIKRNLKLSQRPVEIRKILNWLQSQMTKESKSEIKFKMGHDGMYWVRIGNLKVRELNFADLFMCMDYQESGMTEPFAIAQTIKDTQEVDILALVPSDFKLLINTLVSLLSNDDDDTSKKK